MLQIQKKVTLMIGNLHTALAAVLDETLDVLLRVALSFRERTVPQMWVRAGLKWK